MNVTSIGVNALRDDNPDFVRVRLLLTHADGTRTREDFVMPVMPTALQLAAGVTLAELTDEDKWSTDAKLLSLRNRP